MFEDSTIAVPSLSRLLLLLQRSCRQYSVVASAAEASGRRVARGRVYSLSPSAIGACYGYILSLPPAIGPPRADFLDSRARLAVGDESVCVRDVAFACRRGSKRSTYRSSGARHF
eukprot:1622564-Pyramimonas_sp.AAC.2